MKTENENQKSKLCLKRVSNQSEELCIQSLDVFREVDSYTWTAENITDGMGFPACVKDTDVCTCCEGQLFVMRHGAKEHNQSMDSFGQMLTMINHENGSTDIFTRTLHPLLNNGEWTTWQMVAKGDPKLIAENNNITEVLTSLRQHLEDDSRRIEVAEASLLAGITVRFHRIEESEAAINTGMCSAPAAIVYYKTLGIFVAADSTGAYWDNWDGMEAYMRSGSVRKDKLYLCGDDVYIYTDKGNLYPILTEVLLRGIIQNRTTALPFDVVEGHYISRYGYLVPLASGCYSAPIPVSKGDVIVFNGTGGSSGEVPQVASISITDSKGSYYTPVVIRGEGVWYSSYYVENDGYVSFSWLNHTTPVAYKSNSELLKQLYDYTDAECSHLSTMLIDEIDAINSRLELTQEFLGISNKEVELEIISGSYITYYGGLAPLGSYSYAKPIFVKKGSIVTTYSGGTAEASAAIAITDSEVSTKFTVIQLHTRTEEGVEEFSYQVPRDCYVTVSGNDKYGLKMYVSSLNTSDKDTLKALERILKFTDKEVELELIENNYINSNGSIVPFNGYSYAKPILVKKGNVVTTYSAGTEGSSAAIAVSDIASPSKFTVIQLHTTTISGMEEFSYQVPKDCYVTVSGHSGYDIKIYVKSIELPYEDTIKTVEEIFNVSNNEVELEVIPGFYITYYGGLAPLGSYSYAKPVFVKKGSIVTTYSGGTAEASAAIAVADSDTAERFTVIQLHTKTMDGIEEFSYQVPKDCYVTVSGGAPYGLKMYVKSVDVSASIPEVDYSEVNSDYNKWVYSFVDKCICIGDSVTEGHVYDYPRTKANGDVLKQQSYPTRLAKLTGWEIENAGFSGISAIDWWKNKLNNYQYTDYEIAIIELGYNGGLTDTLDVDVEPYGAYAEYAETNTGCYCKIIEAIKERNPNMFIVLNISSLMKEGSANSTVIKKIAERYSLPYIDLSVNSHFDLDDARYHGYTNESMSLNLVHFNALGYCAKAGFIYNELASILIDNGKELNDRHAV